MLVVVSYWFVAVAEGLVQKTTKNRLLGEAGWTAQELAASFLCREAQL